MIITFLNGLQRIYLSYRLDIFATTRFYQLKMLPSCFLSKTVCWRFWKWHSILCREDAVWRSVAKYHLRRANHLVRVHRIFFHKSSQVTSGFKRYSFIVECNWIKVFRLKYKATSSMFEPRSKNRLAQPFTHFIWHHVINQ